MNDVVFRLAAALNAHDVDAAAALIDENYRSEQPAHPAEAFVGRAQMQANWRAMLAGIPDFHAELVRSTDDGDTTWCEWSWSGNRSDGQEFQVRGVTLFRIRDGKIAAGRLYMEEVDRETQGIEDGVEKLSGQRPESRPGPQQ